MSHIFWPGLYIEPTQRDFNLDVYLLHVETNELSPNKSPEQISLDILNLANSLKLDNSTVIVSSIVPRDNENKKKADEVNIILEELCYENNVGMILHRNINPKKHLNRSRLHLNDDCVSLFVRNSNVFLDNFDKILLQNKHSLAACSSLFLLARIFLPHQWLTTIF